MAVVVEEGVLLETLEVQEAQAALLALLRLMALLLSLEIHIPYRWLLVVR